MLAFHLMLHARDGAPLARDVGERRLVADVLLGLGEGFGLLAFRVGGNHGHVIAATDRASFPAPGRRFEPARVVGIDEQRHLAHAFDHVLRNEARHGLAADLAHEASSLPDLLGMRVVGAYTARGVREALPEVRRERLLQILGAPDLAPAFDATLLLDAACAAVARMDLAGRSPLALAGRTSLVRVAGAALSTAELAAMLDATPRAVQRLRTMKPWPALDQAVVLQMGLRARLPRGLATAPFDAPVLGGGLPS